MNGKKTDIHVYFSHGITMPFWSSEDMRGVILMNFQTTFILH